MRPLAIVDAEVASRCASIAAERDWPCRRGCDACCRNLAAPLEISALEFLRLQAAFFALQPARREEIRARIDALSAEQRPFVCPFLDRARGECSVYDARPIACRSFGFYAGRDGGRWCGDVEAFVNAGGAEGAIFGNHDALEGALVRDYGERRRIDELFRAYIPAAIKDR